MMSWPRRRSKRTKPEISVVVIGYNMSRELARTIYTLQPPYQAGLNEAEIEIILVDNGSDTEFRAGPSYSNIKYLHVENPTQSPAAAINLGLSHASSDFIGLMIDGARMASPQLLRYALLANRINNRAVVSTLAYHLGPDVQVNSIGQGYNQEVEDQLLESVPWRSDGYELFNISVLAASSEQGWFALPSESNALFMSRVLWNELEGVDERFTSPGGGLINHDTFYRACNLPAVQPVSLLGEGTFHQVHGGIATNSKKGKYAKLFRDEYEAIRGRKFSKPTNKPVFLGGVQPQHFIHIEKSISLHE